MPLRYLPVGAAIALFIFTAAPATAQLLAPSAEPRQELAVRPMNFDLWCQETMRYGAERCGQRLAADMREFEAFRSIIEREETEYLMEQRQDAEAMQRADRDYGTPWRNYTDPLGR